MHTTRIIEAVSAERFRQLIQDKVIRIGAHALVHLSDAQRDVFQSKTLTDPVVKERPRGVGLQKNGRYAVYYRRKDRFLKLIINITNSEVEIVTFMYELTMPNLRIK